MIIWIQYNRQSGEVCALGRRKGVLAHEVDSKQHHEVRRERTWRQIGGAGCWGKALHRAVSANFNRRNTVFEAKCSTNIDGAAHMSDRLITRATYLPGSSGDPVHATRSGFAYDAFRHLQQRIDLPIRVLAPALGVSVRTLKRREREGQLTTAESARLVVLADGLAVALLCGRLTVKIKPECGCARPIHFWMNRCVLLEWRR